LTVLELDDKLVGRLRRTILRILQQDGPLTRTQLSVQVRPHSEHWDLVLDDLIDRGYIVREAVIKDNNRAAISYRLTTLETPEVSYKDLTPEEVNVFIERLEPLEPGASAASA
jgi:predicted ArsR family transcriptional regulator